MQPIFKNTCLSKIAANQAFCKFQLAWPTNFIYKPIGKHFYHWNMNFFWAGFHIMFCLCSLSIDSSNFQEQALQINPGRLAERMENNLEPKIKYREVQHAISICQNQHSIQRFSCLFGSVSALRYVLTRNAGLQDHQVILPLKGTHRPGLC